MDAPEHQQRDKPDLVTIFLFWLTGIDLAMMMRCPRHDWGVGRSLGLLMCFTWLYQTGLFSLIGEKLFAQPGQFRPEIVLVAAMLATEIMLIDSFMIMRSEWFASGVAWLKKCGIDISGGRSDRIRMIFGLCIRIILSIGVAQMTAIFVALLIFGSTILARIDSDDLRMNAAVILRANTQIEQQINRETDAYNAESANLQALSKQLSAVRQNVIDPAANDPAVVEAEQEVRQLIDRQAKDADDVRSAEAFANNEVAGIKRDASNTGQPGEGPRYKGALDQIANAKAHAQQTDTALAVARARLEALRNQTALSGTATKQQAHDQLPSFENQLTVEQSKLATLQAHLDDLTRDREQAIRAAVEAAPDHVARDTGFLAQISALEEIAASDSRIAAVILLIDVTSFGFELAAVLAKVTSLVPTTYSALLVAEFYMRAVRITNRMAAELNNGDQMQAFDVGSDFADEPIIFAAANDNHVIEDVVYGSASFCEQDEQPPDDPPKRGRGRPPKSSAS